MSKIVNFFKKIDFMGKGYELSFNGSTQYKTLTGGFISLVLACLLIIGSVYFGKEIFLKNNPVVIPSYEIFNDFNKTSTTNELFFMVGVQTPFYDYYIDDSIYTIEGNYYGYTTNENNSQIFFYEPFQPILCNKLYNESKIAEFLPGYTYDLSKFWCIPEQENNYIEGFFGSHSNREVQFIVNKCKNTTESQKCKPEEKLTEVLQGGIVAIQANRYVLDPKNLDSPLKIETVDTFQGLSLGLQIDFYFGLKVLEFQTDVGFLLTSYQHFKKFDFNDPKLIYTLKNKDSDDGILSKISFFGTNKGFKYLRNYEKIQEVVTKIGGFLKAITLIGNFISFLSSHIEFNNDIIFNLEQNNKDERENLILNKNEINNSNNNLRNNAEMNELRNRSNSDEMINNIKENNNLKINNFVKILNKNFKNNAENEILKTDISNSKIGFVLLIKNYLSSLYAYVFVDCCSNQKSKINLLEKSLVNVISVENMIKINHFILFLQSNLNLIDEENKLSSKFSELDLYSEYTSMLIK